MTFLLPGLACSLAIFCYVQNEITASQKRRTIQSILSNLSYVSDLAYIVNSNDGFVYSFAKNSNYPTLFDPFFNFSTKGLIFYRVVEYCQSSKFKKNHHHLNLSKNIWFNELINKSFANFGSFQMAHHTLSSKFFEGKHPTRIFYPSPAELSQFRKSDVGKFFNYIGHGWFYHSVNKSLNAKIYNEHLFLNLFNKCSIGDIRMRIGVYAPPNVSVFGWKRDKKIKIMHDIKGRKYGAIREGEHSAQELFYYSNGFDSNETILRTMKIIFKNRNLRIILKEFFPYRFFAFISAFTMILLFSPSQIYFLMNLLFILDSNIYFRAIIWPDTFFASDSFWTSLTLIQFATLLYIFFNEGTSETAYISFYSMTFLIILFQSKDIFHSDDSPFVLMDRKKFTATNSSK